MIALKLLYGVGAIHLTVLAITLYLHRAKTHRAVTLTASAENFFKFWLWFACGMNPEDQIGWIAEHRQHHDETDTENDPHNPQQKGPLKLFLFAYFFYSDWLKRMHATIWIPKPLRDPGLTTQKTLFTETEFEHYSKGYVETKFGMLLNQVPGTVGLVTSLVLYTWAFGWFGFWLWLLQTLWMPQVAGGVINVLGHTVGHRPYATEDTSHSLAPKTGGLAGWTLVGLLSFGTGGEHLHNPHHMRESSARFGTGRGLNFDIGYWWLCQLEKIGAVKAMHIADEFKE